MCGEEAIMHGGRVQGPAGSVSAPKPLVMMRQGGAFQSPFNPMVNISTLTPGGGEEGTPHFTVTGPTVFGGCSELCCKSTFPVRNVKGEEAATITKMPPRNCCGCLDEIATDVDTYKVEFSEGTSPEDKAAILSTAILTDYMFFEGDDGICKSKPNGDVVCTFFLCYCCGATCPCCITVNSKNGGADRGGK